MPALELIFCVMTYEVPVTNQYINAHSTCNYIYIICPSQWLHDLRHVCGRSPTKNVGSNPTGGMDVHLL